MTFWLKMLHCKLMADFVMECGQILVLGSLKKPIVLQISRKPTIKHLEVFLQGLEILDQGEGERKAWEQGYSCS